MSAHWWLAIRCVAWMVVLAVPVGMVVLYFYGVVYSGAFLYGVGVGIASFVSTAATVSLLTGRSTASGMMIGGASFGVRYGFAAAALGIPAYLGLWPAVAMLVGFAGVYLAENVMLLPGMVSIQGNAGRSVGERVERRVGA